MTDWDLNSDKLRENLLRVAREARDTARRRERPTPQMACGWHRQMMEGLEVAETAWIGRFRGEAGLEGVRVEVAGLSGTEPDLVDLALRSYFKKLTAALSILDDRNPGLGTPSAEQVRMVVRLAGWAHAEWIRIHPLANGNGRIARMWANWILMRYNIPPFVRLRPRPGGLEYEKASSDAMRGDWKSTVALFETWLP